MHVEFNMIQSQVRGVKRLFRPEVDINTRHKAAGEVDTNARHKAAGINIDQGPQQNTVNLWLNVIITHSKHISSPFIC